MQIANELDIFNEDFYQVAEITAQLRVMLSEASAQQNPPWNTIPDATIEKNNFGNYDGHYITIAGRTILALAGPRDATQLNNILHGLAHGKKSITSIVALVKNETPHKEFYASYFQPEYPIACNDFEIEKSIFAINIIQNADTTFSEKNNLETSCVYAGIENLPTPVNYNVQCVGTNLQVKSKFKQAEGMIKVYSIPVYTGGSTIMSSSPNRKEIHQEKNKRHIQFLLEIYKEWQVTRAVAIHCELGSSRTAHLALVFFLLAQFDAIFVPNNPVRTARNIVQLYIEMKKQRNILNPSESQLSSAVTVALLMKQALCKELNKSKQLNANQTNLSSSIRNLVSQTAHLSFWSNSNNILINGAHPREEVLPTSAALTESVAECQKDKVDEAPSNCDHLLPRISPPG